MEDNPYFKMVSLLRGDVKSLQDTCFRIGRVVNASPLQVEVMDTIQDADTLKKSAGMEFQQEDILLLVTLDDNQTFIILSKVVEI